MEIKERVDNPKSVDSVAKSSVFRCFSFLLTAIIVLAVSLIIFFFCKVYVFPAISLKSEIGVIDDEVDAKRYPNGLSVDDVYALSSARSKAATDMYGFGRNVYVLSSDPKLIYLLANYHDRKYEKYCDNESSKMPDGKRHYEQFSGPVARAVLGISQEQWGRFATHLLLTHPGHSAAVEIYERDSGRNVIFLRGTSTSSLLAGNEIPYATSLGQVNQWSLPHELAHSWDFELLDRKRGVAQISKHISLSEDEADLIAESIADLTTALILLRTTGNDDTLNYQVIPFRTRVLKDHIHATQYLLRKTYGKFTVSQVIGRTDFELSRLAIAAVEKEVVDNPEEFKRFLVEHRNHAEPASKMSAAQRQSAAIAGRELLDHSMNNLVYHGETYEQCTALLKAVEKQIEDFADAKLGAALQSNPFFCDDQTKQADALKQFASDAGLMVDWASHERFEANSRSVDAYYDSLIK